MFAAPIQINFLGYPGTLGSNSHDYIIADKTLILENSKSNYSEKIIYLPNCYMPQDSNRIASNKALSRTMFNLPENGFVFCCFNNSFKITPKEFDIWMGLLSLISGSVLWLLKANMQCETNLKTEANKRGVDPNRLIFADKLPVDEHLARHKLADLFLDTFNFNAHTTASDALSVGLPVLTKTGNGFAARVASSLLNSLEVPELITTSENEYESLALALASNPEKLASLKKKLSNKLNSAPLFDTKRYTKDLEKAYTLAYERHINGLPPTELKVL
jgi:predicted O-linked N-acetylglucosamine transferase (SPINDLY family)